MQNRNKKEKKNQCQLKKMESQKFKTDMFSTVQEEKTEKKRKRLLPGQVMKKSEHLSE